jgi:hypothetical protein
MLVAAGLAMADSISSIEGTCVFVQCTVRQLAGLAILV